MFLLKLETPKETTLQEEAFIKIKSRIPPLYSEDMNMFLVDWSLNGAPNGFKLYPPCYLVGFEGAFDVDVNGKYNHVIATIKAVSP